MNHRERIVEPLAGWEAYREMLWGENSGAVERWFAKGDSLKQPDLDMHFDDGEVRLAKARAAVRSMACLLGFVPASQQRPKAVFAQ